MILGGTKKLSGFNTIELLLFLITVFSVSLIDIRISIILLIGFALTFEENVILLVLFSQFFEGANSIIEGVTFSKIIAVIYVILFMKWTLLKKRELSFGIVQFVILVLFILWYLSGLLLLKHNFVYIYSVSDISLVIILIISLGIMIQVSSFDKITLDRILEKILLTACILSLMIFVMSFTHGHYEFSWDETTKRFTIGLFNINQIAYLVTFLSIMVLTGISFKKKNIINLILVLSLGCNVFILVKTGSKTGILSLGLMTILYILLKFKPKLRNIFALTAMLFALVLISQRLPGMDFLFDRITSSLTDLDTFTSGRFSLSTEPLVYFWNNGPVITGYGSSEYVDRSLNILLQNVDNVSHNSFVSILIRNGLIGLILYISYIFIFIIGALKFLLNKNKLDVIIYPVLTLLLVSIAYNLEYSELMWYWLTLAITIVGLVSHKFKEEFRYD